MSEFASIQKLWKEHMSRPFPRSLAGKKIDGWELVLLDSSAAGCISTFFGSGGEQSLDTQRLQVLDNCAQSLSRICPQLPAEHRVYFDTLRQISERVVAYSPEDLR
jgi:hypothetical protein